MLRRLIRSMVLNTPLEKPARVVLRTIRGSDLALMYMMRSIALFIRGNWFAMNPENVSNWVQIHISLPICCRSTLH